MGIYDRVVVQELIKTIAQTKQINSIEQRSFKGLSFQPSIVNLRPIMFIIFYLQ